MIFKNYKLFSGANRWFAVCLLAGSSLLTGCASIYVDTATKEVPVSELKKPASPQPVQLVFEFQNQGMPVPRATEFLQAAVKTQVAKSGLFSAVETQPAAGMPILNISLNNIPLTKGNASGFVTGLTFGAVGTAVTDGYVCTVSYLPAGSSKPIVKTARHAIHTTVGNAEPPAGAQKSANIGDAVLQMTHEVLSNALRDLSQDSGFGN